MFDILMQKKKVILINEQDLSSNLLTGNSNCLMLQNDPIESEILKFDKDNNLTLHQTDINNNRIIIKFLGWNPSLFNNVSAKAIRG